MSGKDGLRSKLSQNWGSGRTRRSRRSQHQLICFRGLPGEIRNGLYHLYLMVTG